MQEFKLNKQDIDLQILCLQIADDFYPAALETKLSFQVAVPLNLKYKGDPIYLTRALGNIIRNAIAYATPKTEISLHATTSKMNLLSKLLTKEKKFPLRLYRIFLMHFTERILRATQTRAELDLD